MRERTESARDVRMIGTRAPSTIPAASAEVLRQHIAGFQIHAAGYRPRRDEVGRSPTKSADEWESIMKTRYTAGAALGDAAIQSLHAQIMSHEFEGLDAAEKAGIERALKRFRRLASQIESVLRPKRHERFVDKLSLADFYASLEHAADVLGQQSRTTASVVKGSQARHRQ
jgi:hypothetical protein